MRARALAFRVLRITTLSLLAILPLAFVYVQSQQYLLRYRATHLLADFHSLRLKQSTWPDAQRLIFHWGAFGHYDGTCTAAECSYVISLQDQESEINPRLYEFMEAHWPQSYSGNTLHHVIYALGGRGARMRMTFLVENGILERSSVGVNLDVPPERFWCNWNCGEYELLANATAKDQLRAQVGGYHVLGDDKQLAQHPDYKAGRPDGCENCMEASVTFTPYLDQKELQRITSYNTSCFGGFHVCRTLPEVLPAARDWHLYPQAEGTPEPPDPPGPPKPCDIPIFALGRDAESVLAVKVLSVHESKAPPDSMYPSGRTSENAKVQFIAALKGSATWSEGATIDATPYSWDTNFPWEASEHFTQGQVFIVLPDTQYTGTSHISMPRCGIFPDSPQVREKLKKGFAQNDKLRHPETYVSLNWW